MCCRTRGAPSVHPWKGTAAPGLDSPRRAASMTWDWKGADPKDQSTGPGEPPSTHTRPIPAGAPSVRSVTVWYRV